MSILTLSGGASRRAALMAVGEFSRTNCGRPSCGR